jgi:drug/metabolite transporter (DMT)-like permease
VTAVLTILALVAFAANSVLCRLALRGGSIDPATFTTVRLVFGTVALLIVMRATANEEPSTDSSMSGTLLFLYALPFSLAYTQLTTATGALILFGAVQVTMLLGALFAGERPGIWQWSGLAVALGGLVYLMLPGLEAPPASGAALMTLAGVAWGVYSLRGRGSTNPVGQTKRNFTWAMILAVVFSALQMRYEATTAGIALAASSGALASGLGYVAWYSVLPKLPAARAAVLQLAVPVLASAAGVLLLNEPLPARLVIGAALVLGGIGLTLCRRGR